MVKVISYGRAAAVQIILTADLVKFFKKRDVVVSENDGEIMIRESVIMDNKTRKISTVNVIPYSNNLNSKDLIGEYSHRIDGDFLILTKI